MSKTAIPLSKISVASPCAASWDAMKGDDAVRFCGQCSKHVYNLSALSEAEAQALIEDREGEMCARFYARADGTMLTADCPVGWRAVQRRYAIIGVAGAAFVFAVFSFLTVGALFAFSDRNAHRAGNGWNPITSVRDWLFPPRVMVMGEICVPPPVAVPPGPPPGENVAN